MNRREFLKTTAAAGNAQDQCPSIVSATRPAQQPIKEGGATLARRGRSRELERAVAVVEIERATPIGANGLTQLGQSGDEV